jgi:inner membrane protein
MNTSLNQQHIQTTDLVTTPTPLNNFLWMAYALDTSGFWFGYYSIFDKKNEVTYFHINQNNNLLLPYQQDESVKILKQFSKEYYCITKKEEEVYFNDLRFGQIGGWYKPTDEFVFSFKLKKDADNSMALDRNKFNGSYTDAISSLVNRIKR